MKVSIITATFNSASTIGDTILSVKAQSYKDIEYIIIDGVSTDGTLAIIDKHMDIVTRMISEKDEGIYDALNKGIAQCTGDVIGILHSDDFFAGPDVIRHYVQTFGASDAEAVYADLHYVSRSDPRKVIRNWKSGHYRPGLFRRGWMPPHPTFFVRRYLYEKFGTFNLSLKSAADYELMLRFVHRYGVRMAYLPEVTVKMRVGGKSNASLSNRIKANLEDRLAWKLNGMKPAFYTLFLKPLRKIFQFL